MKRYDMEHTMGEITAYEMVETGNGDYVLYDDAMKRIKELEEELANAEAGVHDLMVRVEKVEEENKRYADTERVARQFRVTCGPWIAGMEHGAEFIAAVDAIDKEKEQ